jgi:hypothetical protein
MKQYPALDTEFAEAAMMDYFFKLYGPFETLVWLAFCLAYFDLELLENELGALPNELIVLPDAAISSKLSKKTQTALKRIPDALFKILTKRLSDPKKLTKRQLKSLKQVLHIEYQHWNDPDLIARLLVYSGMIRQVHKKHQVLQMVLYTGDKPMKSPPKIDEKTMTLKPMYLDLTKLNSADVMGHFSMHVNILSIFNHGIPDEEKASFMYDKLVALYQSEGREAFNYYTSLTICGTTKHNFKAMSLLKEKLAKNSPLKQELKYNPFYNDWVKEGEEIGIEKGLKKGEKIGLKKGEEIGIEIGLKKGEKIGLKKGEEIGMEKGMEKGSFYANVENALKLMQTMNLDAEQASDALQLDEEMRKELNRRLKARNKRKPNNQ